MLSLSDNSDFNQLLDQLEEAEDDEEETRILKGFFREKVLEEVQAKFEKLMKAEREAFLEEEADEENGANGYYNRDLDMEFGKMEDLDMPRDRESECSTRLFGKYQRRDDWLEEIIIQLNPRGMSTRDITDFLEKLFGAEYSHPTVSRITDITLDEVQKWRNREIDDAYYVLYVDAFVVDLRRDSVEKEAIYMVSGVNTDGYREVLGFYVGGNESATVWKEMLSDLKDRGLERVLLFVADDLSGLHEVIKEVFPKADTQPCVFHKMKNSLKNVRSDDREEVAEDLRKIHRAKDRTAAGRYMREFAEKWGREVSPCFKKLREGNPEPLLTFMEYPESIRSVIYHRTTSVESRECLQGIPSFNNCDGANDQGVPETVEAMNTIPTIEAAQKIVYLKTALINSRWSKRRLRGLKPAKSKQVEMMQERYPNVEITQRSLRYLSECSCSRSLEPGSEKVMVERKFSDSYFLIDNFSEIGSF